jgi:hypothetical protein
MPSRLSFVYHPSIRRCILADGCVVNLPEVLRGKVNASSCARNSDIHRDLGIRMVAAEIKRTAKKHENRRHQHTNVEAIQLLDKESTVRRLKRLKPF